MIERPLVTVGGLIIAPDGDVLLVRSKKWQDLYSLPGGKVEWGETRLEAFQREVREETGLEITNIRFALVQDCVFSNEFWQKRHFVMNDFIADLGPGCPKDRVCLNDEAYHHIWINPKEAFHLPLHKECRHLLEWYIVHLKQKGNERAIVGFEHHHIRCIIGILPHERVQEQDLYIDAKVETNFAACRLTDRVGDTLDYVRLTEICTEIAQNKKYGLLETLISDILDQFMQNDRIKWAWVRIKKPAALPSANYAFVELERRRQE
ncbi:dihydroneopterin aldolase [Candidatus Protochlamydia phocaeensis]|uniref:dihydroneopterin aldolase n=1 Tax=Candidatus Protochlamydia phocaeensis TaxID=1414722 RepID=UPI000837D0AF|nr:dihydroneopterin aldolase [Candidatus Protochlamydia phocaeensis]